MAVSLGGIRAVILSYSEASAYATELAKYMLLATLGPLIFVWAWQNLAQYLYWGVTTEADEQIELLEQINEGIGQLIWNSQSEDHTVQLEIRR